MLWAYDFKDMSHAIRFGLFHDEDSPRSSLLFRNTQFINEFLVAASEPHQHCRLSELSHPQKVEEILLRSSIQQLPLITWSWFPTIPGRSSGPGAIALEIEGESHRHFQQIAFEDIVRSALGHKAVSVEWFFQQHTSLYALLVEHLRMHPEELLLYLAVEKVGDPLSPQREIQFKENWLIGSHSIFGIEVPLPIKPFPSASWPSSQMASTICLHIILQDFYSSRPQSSNFSKTIPPAYQLYSRFLMSLVYASIKHTDTPTR